MFNHQSSHRRGGGGHRHGAASRGGDFFMGRGMAAPGDGTGRRRRMFDGGELRLLLLALIAEAPRHGYDLIREIEARTGGAYAPSPGVVYPTLTLLGDMGLIAPHDTDGAKKMFAITDAGRTHLDENKDVVAALMARLGALGQDGEQGRSRPVRRAIGNLRTAVQGRIGDADCDRATIDAITDILDDAARRIERL